MGTDSNTNVIAQSQPQIASIPVPIPMPMSMPMITPNRVQARPVHAPHSVQSIQSTPNQSIQSTPQKLITPQRPRKKPDITPSFRTFYELESKQDDNTSDNELEQETDEEMDSDYDPSTPNDTKDSKSG